MQPAQFIEQGNELLGKGLPHEALAFFREAHRLAPTVISGYSIGVALENSGDKAQATTAYKAALHFDPRRLEPRVNAGILLRDAGAVDEAFHHHLTAYGQAPEHRLVLRNLAITCQVAGRLTEAEYLLGKYLAIDPGDMQARQILDQCLDQCLGMPFIAEGNVPAEAAEVAACRIGALYNPSSAIAWARLADAYASAANYEWAWDAYLSATDLNPDHVNFWAQFEAISRRLGHEKEALRALEVLVRLNPANSTVWNNLGSLLLGQRRYDEAVLALKEGLQLDPQNVMLMRNLAFAYARKEDARNAYDWYNRAWRQAPESAELTLHIIALAQSLCEWKDIEQLFASLVRHLSDGRMDGVDPFSLLFIPGVGAALQRKVATHFLTGSIPGVDAVLQRQHAGHRAPRWVNPAQAPPIHVGYVSGEFRTHPTAWLIAEIIEMHDRTNFKVTGFSTAGEEDTAIRRRLRTAFDEFVDIESLSDEQAAEAIRSHDVDILIDLNVYTGTERLGVFARRPAPIQINYLGFPGTSGAPFMDYIIADNLVIPPKLEPFYSETVLRLPHCYQPNDRKRPLPPIPAREAVGLPGTGLVFCSFNAIHKITPDVFDLWCRLLREVPGSVLWILSSNGEANANLQREARERGVEASRLIFGPWAPLDQHLARFRCADLFLDTFPCTAHTTASDALWCGVPVVTRIGETFASRVSASILGAAGLASLITEDAESYHDLAYRLATNPRELNALKRHLDEVRYSCPLFDSAAYTRDLEALYRSVAGQDRVSRGGQAELAISGS